MAKPKYRRILLKLSGEAMSRPGTLGIAPDVVSTIADQIREVRRFGIETGIVMGGGNIFRGSVASQAGMDRVTADYMGMLATVINALALQDALEKKGVITRVMTAIEMQKLAEPFIRRRALRHLEKGRVVIFAGGTGNPYMTTDTTAALRANEINAEIILKATQVDGVYDSDPKKNPKAKRYEHLNYLDVLQQNLRVMDSTAISFCRENNIPILVFNFISRPGSIIKAVMGAKIGTLVNGG